MAPKIPVELAEAKEHREQAYKRYEETDKKLKDAARFTCQLWDDTVTEWYNRWQALGGTSDIRSIVALEEERAKADAIVAAHNERTSHLHAAWWYELLRMYDEIDYMDHQATINDARASGHPF